MMSRRTVRGNQPARTVSPGRIDDVGKRGSLKASQCGPGAGLQRDGHVMVAIGQNPIDCSGLETA